MLSSTWSCPFMPVLTLRNWCLNCLSSSCTAAIWLWNVALTSNIWCLNCVSSSWTADIWRLTSSLIGGMRETRALRLKLISSSDPKSKFIIPITPAVTLPVWTSPFIGSRSGIRSPARGRCLDTSSSSTLEHTSLISGPCSSGGCVAEATATLTFLVLGSWLGL